MNILYGYQHSFTLLKNMDAMLPIYWSSGLGGGCTGVNTTDIVPAFCNLKFFSCKLLSENPLQQNNFQTVNW